MFKLIFLVLLIPFYIYGFIFPVFSYSKETGIMAGAFYQKQIIPENQTSLQLFFLSQKKGSTGFVNVSNYFFKSRLYDVKFNASNTGETFYGIQNYTSSINNIDIYATQLNFKIDTKTAITPEWDFIYGFSYEYYQPDSDNPLSHLNHLGIALGFESDFRDQEFNTKQGYYKRLTLESFTDYQTLSADLRYYFPYKNNTFAFKTYLGQTFTNNNHTHYLQQSGQYFYLRGYPSKRYIDQALGYLQFEYRLQVFSFLHFVPFIEMGGIGSSLFEMKKSLFSYGFAFHWPFTKGMTLRIEKAFAEDNQEFYIGFNHVF